MGLVQVTRNGGANWTDVTSNISGLPELPLWTSRVEASKHDAGTAYATFDGHWVGDTNPYVFKTTNFGTTWMDISSDIPREMPGNSVYTIVEDHVNPDLLFIGTEFGCFITWNGGESWHPFMNNLPPVAVHDLVIHPRENDLIAGTHGRSIWIADDIAPLQQMNPGVPSKPLTLFESKPGTRWNSFNKGRIQTHFKFRGKNPPSGAAIRFYLDEMPGDSIAVVEIADLLSGRIQSIERPVRSGMNEMRWNMRFDLASDEIAAHQERLKNIAETLRQKVRTSKADEVLFHMARDLRAGHRAPGLFKDIEYSHLDDDRDLLIEHLRLIEDKIKETTTAGSLSSMRNELIAYSTLIGDEAYMGYFGGTIQPVDADAGIYIVTIKAGTHRVQGQLEVRVDPLNR